MNSHGQITRILESAAAGQQEAANELFAIVYSELRQLADRQMRSESADHTLQSTALVHEVWLKLVVDQQAASWKSRAHFFAAAAQAMRRILVDAARSRRRIKRGGDRIKVELQNEDAVVANDEQLLALDEALDQLRQVDERKARLVDLRYFAGLTNAQAAEQLNISPATAERHWAFAKAWLRNCIDES